MALINEQKIQQQLSWLIEQIRCIKQNCGDSTSVIGAFRINVGVFTEDTEPSNILDYAVNKINLLPPFRLETNKITFFFIKINDTEYVVTFKDKNFEGIFGAGQSQLIFTDLQIISKEKDIFFQFTEEQFQAVINLIERQDLRILTSPLIEDLTSLEVSVEGTLVYIEENRSFYFWNGEDSSLLENWITLQGIQGELGPQGVGIQTIEYSTNGNVIITLTNGEVFQSPDSLAPEGIYELAVRNGFTGTELEFIESLRGPQGPQGLPGFIYRLDTQNNEIILLEDNVEVSRIPISGGEPTVNTIEDLKAIENPVQGQLVKVTAHNSNGVSKKLGGGYFYFDSVPEFAIANPGGYSLIPLNRVKNPLTTPLKSTYTANQANGTNFRTEFGTVMTLRATNDRSSGDAFASRVELVEAQNNGLIEQLAAKGSTIIQCWLYVIDENYALNGTEDLDLGLGPNINPGGRNLIEGERFFLLEDDATVIRPNYVGFDGVGVWRRVMPSDGYLTPEMAGGIPNGNAWETPTRGTGFDSTQALQRIFDNLEYPVHVTPGYWYTSQTLVVRRNKQYKSAGLYTTVDSTPQGRFGLNGERNLPTPVCGVVHTDQNIDVIAQRSARVNDSNFNIDTQSVPLHAKHAYVIDLNWVHSAARHLKVYVVGNYETLFKGADLGTNGLVFKTEGAAPGGTSMTNLSSFFFSDRIEVGLINCNIGVWRQPDTGLMAHNTNGVEIDIRLMSPVKQLIRSERNMGCRYYCNTVQAHKCVQKVYRNRPFIVLTGRDQFDGYPMDWKWQSPDIKYYKGEIPLTEAEFTSAVPANWQESLDEVTGIFEVDVNGVIYKAQEFWIPRIFVEAQGTEITLGVVATREFFKRPDIYSNIEMAQNDTFPIGLINNSNYIIPKRGSNQFSGSIISALNNNFLFIDKIHSKYYVKGFVGAGVDHDVFLDMSEGIVPENSNITISNPKSIVNISGADCIIAFNNNADFVNDYAELEISGGAALRTSNRLWITIASGTGLPREIHLITSEGTFKLNTSKKKGVRTFQFRNIPDSNSFFRFRFIGFDTSEFLFEEEDTEIGQGINTGLGGSYSILDITTINPLTNDDVPYIHRGGGQFIYGSLNVIEDTSVPRDFTSTGFVIRERNNSRKSKLLFLGNGTVKFQQWENLDTNPTVRADHLIITDRQISSADINSLKNSTLPRSNTQFYSTLTGQTPLPANGMLESRYVRLTPNPYLLGTNDSFFMNGFFPEGGIHLRSGGTGDLGFFLLSNNLEDGSIAIIKNNRGILGVVRFLWDSEHLTKAQYDSFIRVANLMSNKKFRLRNSSTNLDKGDVVISEVTVSDFTHTLPIPEPEAVVTVSRIDFNVGLNLVIDTLGGANIDGDIDNVIPPNTTKTFISDGTHWYTINCSPVKPKDNYLEYATENINFITNSIHGTKVAPIIADLVFDTANGVLGNVVEVWYQGTNLPVIGASGHWRDGSDSKFVSGNLFLITFKYYGDGVIVANLTT